MSRPLRIEYPNAWYHVMNRGRRGENIFQDKKDYQIFLVLLQETSEMFDLWISAYCLMPNHYHLLVQTPSGNLARSMRHVNGVYTQRYNRRWNIDGQLFRGRYKSVLVEEDSHLLELLRYIHRNPVRARKCESVIEYPWSSHQGYISRDQKWNWLHKKVLLDMLLSDSKAVVKHYDSFVKCEDSTSVTEFFSKKNLASFFGSVEFVTRMKNTFRKSKHHYEVPQSKQLDPTIAEIKSLVCQHFEIEKETLQQTRRGQANVPRNVAIYFARKRCGLSLIEIGKEFGIEKYSSVSSIVGRTEKVLSHDKQLKKRVEVISRQLK